MTEGKEIWRDIYALADNLAINRERLKFLVEDLIGKQRTETAEEAHTVLSFLIAVDGKFKSRTITVDEAIAEAKSEYKKDSKGKAQETLGEQPTDGVAGKKKEQEPIRGRPKEHDEVIDAEGVEEEHWDKTVEIDEGAFKFKEEEGDALLCQNTAGDTAYRLHINLPWCPCLDFQVSKQRQEWCKHLKAAAAGGYAVKELPKLPAEIKDELEKAKPGKGKERKKVVKEEVVTVTIDGKSVNIPIQTPAEQINNEDAAAKMITAIAGINPRYEDVIEKYGDIEEISADVIISMAQYAGVRFQPFNKEVEIAKMNLGKIFLKIPMSDDKRKRYDPLVEFMPDTDVTVRCKITGVAAWRDKAGNLRIGGGTKEEHLTPYELRDIVLRGANFIETKCESKAFKKAIINALPITHAGLLSKIKKAYDWE